MATDPVCKMTIDEKSAAGQGRLQREDVLLLILQLQSDIRPESTAIHQMNPVRNGRDKSTVTSLALSSVPAGLFRRARSISKRTEDAAIACLRAQDRLTLPALVEELTCGRRHCFDLRMSTLWTHNCADGIHRPSPLSQCLAKNAFIGPAVSAASR